MKKVIALIVSFLLLCSYAPCYAVAAEPTIISEQQYQLIEQDELLLARAKAAIDERSVELKNNSSMNAVVEVSAPKTRAGVEMVVTNVMYTTQLIKKVEYSDGSSEEEYVTTAIAEVSPRGSGTSTGGPTQEGTTYVYSRISYSSKSDGSGGLLFTQTGSGHKVTYSSSGPIAQVLSMAGRLIDAGNWVRAEKTGSRNSPVSGTWYTLGAPNSSLYLPKVSCTMNAESIAHLSNGQSVVMNYFLSGDSL